MIRAPRRAGQGARRSLLVGLLVGLLTLGAGCDPEPEAPELAPLPPGNALTPEVDAILYGNGASCRQDTDCPGGVCYFGACVGMLVVDQRWMQSAMTDALVGEVEARPELRERVIIHLVRVLEREDTDLAFRARALLPLERLGALKSLREASQATDDRLADAAALALARAGDPAGLDRVRALSESEQPAIAMEALRALGASGSPDALEPLLRTLNPALDAMLLRAALDGLAALGDHRAITPLVGFLEDSPDYLRHRVTTVLRRISGASLGIDAASWQEWMRINPQPQAPEFSLRPFSAEEELGLPTP